MYDYIKNSEDESPDINLNDNKTEDNPKNHNGNAST